MLLFREHFAAGNIKWWQSMSIVDFYGARHSRVFRSKWSAIVFFDEFLCRSLQLLDAADGVNFSVSRVTALDGYRIDVKLSALRTRLVMMVAPPHRAGASADDTADMASNAVCPGHASSCSKSLG